MGGAFRMHGRDAICVKTSEKPEGKRPLRIRRRRWEDNIKIDDLGCEDVD
jgi:hypothetical protein